MRRNISAFRGKTFDVLVIGGGITGSCIARDAAMRGLTVALVEKQDFSHATSAANSKLVHGGLRYLQTFEFGLVRESLRERRIWQRIAPHLVRPLRFLVPQPKGHKGTLTMRLGLTLYDWLSFDRAWLADPDQRLPGHAVVKPAELAAAAPVAAQTYPDALSYYDCQMHSPERLGLACLADAVASGAVIANYAEVTALARDAAGGVAGARVKDLIGGDTVEIAARTVVNAAGPWADTLMAMAQHGAPRRRLIRAKGIHLIVRSLTNGAALTIFLDRGHVFVMPWRGHSLIGTTDDVFEGPPDTVTPTEADIDTLLATVNEGLPAARLTRADIVHAYAGVRPLIADGGGKPGGSYKQSRKAEIIDHAAEGQPGFLSVLGGKWTTSRAVAATAVDRIEKRLGRRARRSPTGTTPLGGVGAGRLAPFEDAARRSHAGVAPAVIDNLVTNYGPAFDRVIAAAGDDASLLQPLSETVADCGAAIRYAVREEMALTLEDVIFRRTGIGTLGHPGDAVLVRCAAIMGDECGWDEARRASEIAAVTARYHRPDVLQNEALMAAPEAAIQGSRRAGWPGQARP